MSSITDAVANYMNGMQDYGAIGNALNNYGNDYVDYGTIGQVVNDYIGGDGLNNLGTLSVFGKNTGGIDGVNGGWINTLGRLGAGILGGIGDYQASSGQQAYLPYTQWLGNGLAKFSAINNTANKQNQQNQAYGNTLMLSSLFGPGKSLLNRLGGQIGRNYFNGYNSEIYNGETPTRTIEPRYTTGGIEWRDKEDVTI